MLFWTFESWGHDNDARTLLLHNNKICSSPSPGSVLISQTAEEVSLLLTLIWLTSAVHEDEHDDDDDDDDVSPCPGECLH